MWDKLFDTIFSVKFYILVASTVLLVLGYIDQGTWMTMVLTTAGFRTANEIASILKSAPVKASGMVPPRSTVKSSK